MKKSKITISIFTLLLFLSTTLPVKASTNTVTNFYDSHLFLFIADLLITAIFYMAIPLVLKFTHVKFNSTKNLWILVITNSILVKVFFKILMGTMTTSKAYIVYAFINYTLLERNLQKLSEKQAPHPPHFNNTPKNKTSSFPQQQSDNLTIGELLVGLCVILIALLFINLL